MSLQPFGLTVLNATPTVLPDSNEGAKKTIVLSEQLGVSTTIETSRGGIIMSNRIPSKSLIYTEDFAWSLLGNNNNLFPYYEVASFTFPSSVQNSTIINQGFAVSISQDGTLLAVSSLSNNSYYGYGETSVTSSNPVIVWTYSNSVWSVQQEIPAPQANIYFGYSISLSGDGSTLAIGAPYYGSSGAVYIYQIVNGLWTQTALLFTTSFGDCLQGFSVSLSDNGTVLAVGGPYYTSMLANAGIVIIWTLTDGVWSVNMYLPNLTPGSINEYLGWSVSLSLDGNTLAAGSPGYNESEGQVVIYTYNGTTWNTTTYLSESMGSNIQQGYSVSLNSNGTVLASGAPYYETNGAVIIWVLSTSWTFSNLLTVDIVSDQGWSVSLSSSGNILAVGAPVANDQGETIIWTNNSGTWSVTETYSDPSSIGASQGWSVSLSGSGSTVAAGAPNYNEGQGGVYINLQYLLSIDNNTSFYYQGYSECLSSAGTTLAVGMPGQYFSNSNQSAIAIWTQSNGSWSLNNVITYNSAISAYSGYSVALSLDGTVLVVGIPGFNSQQGGAWVFTYSNGQWSQIPSLLSIAGYSSSPLGPGFSVAISPDNKVIAIGSPYTNSAAGVVLIWSYVSNVWTFNTSLTAGTQTGVGVSIGIQGPEYLLAFTMIASGITVQTYTSTLSVGPWTIGTALSYLAHIVPYSYPVAVSENGLTILLGISSQSNDVIAVVWVYSGGTWNETQLSVSGYTSAFQGVSVSLSNDGTVAAVGAVLYGLYGATFVWKYSGGNWTLQSGTPVSTSNRVEQGFSVSLSGAGTTLAVGAPFSFFNVGVVDIWTNPGTWTYVQELEILLSSSAGISVATSAMGTTFATGDPAYSNQGAVIIWNRSTAGIVQNTILLSPYIDTDGVSPYFGQSIALSADGNTLAVGSPGYVNDMGAIFIFIYTNGVWQQQTILTSSVNQLGSFPIALASDGNTLAVGYVGGVLIWVRTGTIWINQIRISGLSPSAIPVSLSSNGNTLAIGDAGISPDGGVYVYNRVGTTWTLTTTLVNTNYTGQGASVAISASGEVIISGVPLYNSNQGGALVWRLINGTWSFSSFLTTSTVGASQGTSVALSGNGQTIAVGGPSYLTNQGGVWIWYYLGDGNWNNPTILTDGTSTSSLQGTSVALSGDGSFLVVGGPGSTLSGVWIYD